MKMRMDVTVDDIHELVSLKSAEALETLKKGTPVIVQLSSRDFYEISEEVEFKQIASAHSRGAYEMFQCFHE